MPTRYRPALAGGETTQQGEEMGWKGMGMMASVCTTIGRLTFTPMDVSAGRWTRRLCRPALWLFARSTRPRRPLISTNRKHQRHMQTFERRHRSCIGAVRESPRAPPDMHPLLPRLSSSLSGQTLLLLRTTTDLHVATNKRRCVFEQALFFPSVVRQQKSNLASKSLHTSTPSSPSCLHHQSWLHPSHPMSTYQLTLVCEQS